MPVSYRIDPARKIAYTTFEGEVTDQELMRHARKIGSDPEIDDSFVELIQADTSSMKGVTGSGVREAADALRVSTAIRKIGIVAPKDVEFGLENLAYQGDGVLRRRRVLLNSAALSSAAERRSVGRPTSPYCEGR